MNCFNAYENIINIKCVPLDAAAFSRGTNEQVSFIDNSNSVAPELIINESQCIDIDTTEMSAKASDVSKLELAGSYRTVTLSFNIDNSYSHLPNFNEQMTLMFNNQYHILLTYITNNQSFIRNDYKTMSVSSKMDSNGDNKVTITIQNINGIQPVYKG